MGWGANTPHPTPPLDFEGSPYPAKVLQPWLFLPKWPQGKNLQSCKTFWTLFLCIYSSTKKMEGVWSHNQYLLILICIIWNQWTRHIVGIFCSTNLSKNTAICLNKVHINNSSIIDQYNRNFLLQKGTFCIAVNVSAFGHAVTVTMLPYANLFMTPHLQ